MARYQIDFDIGSASENMRFSSEAENPLTALNAYRRLAEKGMLPTIYRNGEPISKEGLENVARIEDKK